MLWIKNAPIYGVHDNHEIVTFVYKYISYDVCLFPKDLQDSQTHCTNAHVEKKHQVVCHFHYHLPPLPYTKILEPFDQSFTCEEITKDLTKNCQENFTTLSKLEMNNPMSFNQFLDKLNIYFTTYIEALKNHKKMPTLFFS